MINGSASSNNPLLPPQQQEIEKFRKLLKEVQSNPACAEKLIKEIEAQPFSVESLGFLAICYSSGHGMPSPNPKKTFEYSKMATELFPQSGQAWFLLGKCYFVQIEIGKVLADNNTQLAYNCFKTSLELNPNHLNALCHKGMCHQRLGDYSQAFVSFQKVTQVDPSHLEAWERLGDCYLYGLGIEQNAVLAQVCKVNLQRLKKKQAIIPISHSKSVTLQSKPIPPTGMNLPPQSLAQTPPPLMFSKITPPSSNSNNNNSISTEMVQQKPASQALENLRKEVDLLKKQNVLKDQRITTLMAELENKQQQLELKDKEIKRLRSHPDEPAYKRHKPN